MSEVSKGGIEIRIAADQSTATIVIPADTDILLVDAALLGGMAGEHGVIVDAFVEGRLMEVVKSFRADPRDLEEVFATSRAAVNGTDGWLAWEDGFDPSVDLDPTTPVDGSGTVDQYSRVKYLRVAQGNHVATLHPPTTGENGCDVLGKVLSPVPGTVAQIAVDKSLTVDAEGRLISQTDGILVSGRDEITISRLFEVDGSVDFRTGNIDVDGSVIVKDGIRDRFKVKASENITVEGLIQSAEIDCGGDFHCRSGMVGRDRGSFRVGGDAFFNYVDGVDGRVEGNMFVEREIRRSKLVVEGDLTIARGAIIGGEVTVTGSMRVATLGSNADTPTTVILGDVPILEASLKNIRVEIAELGSRIEEKVTRERKLRGSSDALSVDDEEELALLADECEDLGKRLGACTGQRDEMQLAQETSKNVSIEVAMLIHPRVTIQVGDDAFRFDRLLKGPVTIGWGPSRELQYQQGIGGPTHRMTEVAKLLPREAA